VLQWMRDTGYGLTLGIHSRIQSFVDEVVAAARVGNIYVNRSMIGAVVGVQPFGGEGLSGTGPKAGGPNYLLRFVTERTLTVNTAAVGGVTELLASRAE
jgi:RHH-type proline utilization regulon transcriptional repressor/proline dehydrogenase/delta 1-pyrroline-5-carboxylate dehydrogenase